MSHRFTPEWIESHWVVRRSGRGRYSAGVLFPSSGRHASVSMLLSGGRRVALSRHARALPRGAWLRVRSERSGYIVLPLRRASALTVRLLHPRPLSSAPRPGPTLAVGLAPMSRYHRRELSARLATVSTEGSPEEVARALERP